MSKEYVKVYSSPNGRRTVLDDLPNNSHPLIKHEEIGTYRSNLKHGHTHGAFLEVSSGKMFHHDKINDGLYSAKEIQSPKEIPDKTLRSRFESQLPHIHAYRDGLIRAAKIKESGKDLSLEQRQHMNSLWKKAARD